MPTRKHSIHSIIKSFWKPGRKPSRSTSPLGVERFEDRINPDTTFSPRFAANGFKLIARGDGADFDTALLRLNSLPKDLRSIQSQFPPFGRFDSSVQSASVEVGKIENDPLRVTVYTKGQPEDVIGAAVFSSSPIDVYFNDKFIFELPEGGAYRTLFRIGGQEKTYTDIAPNNDLVAVPTGFLVRAASQLRSNVQTLYVDRSSIGSFRISFQGNKTPAFNAGTSDETIESEINRLPGLESNGMRATVKYFTGDYYTVALYGSYYFKELVPNFEVTDAENIVNSNVRASLYSPPNYTVIKNNSYITPATLVGITSSGANGDPGERTVKSLRIPISGHKQLGDNFPAADRFLGWDGPSTADDSNAVFPIPEGMGSTFPMRNGPAFTPRYFGADLARESEAVVFGDIIYDQFTVGVRLQEARKFNNDRLVGLLPTGDGLRLSSSTANYSRSIVPAGVDNSGRALPATFERGGLKHQITSSYSPSISTGFNEWKLSGPFEAFADVNGARVLTSHGRDDSFNNSNSQFVFSSVTGDITDFNNERPTGLEVGGLRFDVVTRDADGNIQNGNGPLKTQPDTDPGRGYFNFKFAGGVVSSSDALIADQILRMKVDGNMDAAGDNEVLLIKLNTGDKPITFGTIPLKKGKSFVTGAQIQEVIQKYMNDRPEFRDWRVSVLDGIDHQIYVSLTQTVNGKVSYKAVDFSRAAEEQPTLLGAFLGVLGLGGNTKTYRDLAAKAVPMATSIDAISVDFAQQDAQIKVENGALFSDPLKVNRVLLTPVSAQRNGTELTLVRGTPLVLTPEAGGLFARLQSEPIKNANGSIRIPSNTVVLWGSGKLPINIPGVSLSDKALLGSADNPAIHINNGVIQRFKFSLSEVTAAAVKYTAKKIENIADPLFVDYKTDIGTDSSFFVLGGAVAPPNGVFFTKPTNVAFGQSSSEGLRLNHIRKTFSLGYGLVDPFTAGTQTITPDRVYVEGTRVVYDRVPGAANQFAYFFRGTANMAIKVPGGAATSLRVTFNPPPNVTNIPLSRLDSPQVTLYFRDSTTLNGFEIAPLATLNPIRIAIGNGGDTLGGDFALRLENNPLNGTMVNIPFPAGTVPAEGLKLKFTSGWTLAGVNLKNAADSILTTKMKLVFQESWYENAMLSKVASGDNAVEVMLEKGRVQKAIIGNKTGAKVGSVEFSNGNPLQFSVNGNAMPAGFTAEFKPSTAFPAWNFKGQGTFFGEPVSVEVKPTLTIGGDKATGYQLVQKGLPKVNGADDLPPPTMVTFAGVTMDLRANQGWTSTGSTSNGDFRTYTYTTPGVGLRIGGYTVSVSGSASVKVGRNVPAELTALSLTVAPGAKLTIGGATVSLNNVKFAYSIGESVIKISGAAGLDFTARAATVKLQIMLGDETKPGLVFKDGLLESLKLTVTGDFEILKLKLALDPTNGISVSYDRAQSSYEVYGGVLLSTTTKAGSKPLIENMKISLGTEKKPGLRIVNGDLKSLDVTLSGKLNLFGLTAETPADPNDPKDAGLRFRYSSDAEQLRITGTVKITLLKGSSSGKDISLTGGFPGKGLLINLDTGKVEIRGLLLKSGKQLDFGNIKLKDIFIKYEEAENGDVTIAAGAGISLPSGLEVGGSFALINGKLDAIAIKLQKNPGIQVAGGLINIYSIEGGISGLTDLSKFKVTATVRASVGPKVAFGSKSLALADVTGTLTADTEKLVLKGRVVLIGGILGNASFDGELNWNTFRVSFQATIRLYPGDIVRGNMNAYIDAGGDVDFSANFGVFGPNRAPLVGGKELAGASVHLVIRPREPAANSFIEFEARLLGFLSGNIKAKFDAVIDYGFSANFGLFKVRKSGSFRVYDGAVDPRLQILNVEPIAGTPDALVTYTATSPRPNATRISLFADSDAADNDGTFIGSVPFSATPATFVWKNAASYNTAGASSYVYGNIQTDQSLLAFSNYSVPYGTPSGFAPTIANPATAAFVVGRPVVFSSAVGNAITVGDARLTSEATNQLSVTLDTTGGVLTLGDLPENLEIEGDQTSTLRLTGTAAAINAALDGLTYQPDDNMLVAEAIKIEARALPLFSAAAVTTSSIALIDSPIVMTIAEPDEGGLVVLRDGDTPLATLELDNAADSFFVNAKVIVKDFVPGQDSLGITLSEESLAGLTTEFDMQTGELTLSGFARLEDYEFALQNVEFSTRGGAANRTLTVWLQDAQGETTSMDVEVTQIEGPTDLTFTAGGDGVTTGVGPALVLPQAVIAGERISRISIAFEPGTFRPGEDVLSAPASVPGEFDPETGIFTITGEFTAAEYTNAIRALSYENLSPTPTAGARYLTITITSNDESIEEGVGFAAFNVMTAFASLDAPALTLSINSLLLPANDDVIALDPGLKLTADGMILEARVAITGNYRYGEMELQAGFLPVGIDAAFDAETGVLRLFGMASAAAYEMALQNVLYIDNAGIRSTEAAVLTISVRDGLNPAVSGQMTVLALAAPHIAAASLEPAIYSRGETTIPLGLTPEIAGATMLRGAVITLEDGDVAGEDVLLFDAQNGIAGTYDPATGTLTLTGIASVQAYITALGSIRYRAARANPSLGDRVISVVVTDIGGVDSNVVETLLVMDPVIVGPDIALPASPASTYVEGASAVTIAPNLTLAPPDDGDTGSTLESAQVRIQNAHVDQDVLDIVAPAGFTVTFDADEGLLTIDGEGTYAQYQAILRSITYRNTSDVPDTTARVFEIRLSNGGLDSFATMTTNLQATDDTPVLTGGAIAPVIALKDNGLVPLGLALTFDTSDVTRHLTFVATELPASDKGHVLLADDTPLEAGIAYELDQLSGLQFLPAGGADGNTQFTFNVALTDDDTGRRDAGTMFTVPITIRGLATTTGREEYVAQVFRSVLGRNPTAAELGSFTGIMTRAERGLSAVPYVDVFAEPRGDVVETLTNTDEYRTRLVSSLYKDLLGRAPTANELADGVTRLADGTTTATIRGGIVAGTEFFNLHSENGFETYVPVVLAVLTGEVPDDTIAAGLARLNGNGDRAAYVNSIVNSTAARIFENGKLFEDLFGYAPNEDDVAAYDFAGLDTPEMLVALLVADDFYAAHSTPSNSARIRLHETTAFPEVAQVGDTSGYHATGTLISKDYVLVAAHSVAGIAPGQVRIMLNGVERAVARVILNFDYNRNLVGADDANDIALVQLASPVADIVPATLLAGDLDVGQVVNIVGFGTHNGQKYGVKHHGSMAPVSEVNANSFAWRSGLPGQDSAGGDSGAPLYLTFNGTNAVAGIVSGSNGDTSVNTRLAPYLEWISEFVTDLRSVTQPEVTDTADAAIAVGSDVGGTTAGIFNADGTSRLMLTPFGNFTGGIRTALGDFNNDGIADLVVGTGKGTTATVRVIDGATQQDLFRVKPFGNAFTRGVLVAAGDVNGDGVPDLAISPDSGGGARVRIFNGKGFDQLADFFGIDDPKFRGGARVTFGDMNADGVDDLVVAAGTGGGPRVAAFDGARLGMDGGPKLFGDFFTFEQKLRNGSFVAIGDLNGDGFGDLVAGAGPGGGPRVSIIDGRSLVQNGSGTPISLGTYFAGNPASRAGVRVGVKDLDADGQADVVTGPGGGSSRVTVYSGHDTIPGVNPSSALEFDAFRSFRGGVFVG